MSEGHLGVFMRMEEEQGVLDATVEGLVHLMQILDRERREREAEFRRTENAVALKIASHRRRRATDLQHVVTWRNRPYYARFDVVAEGADEPDTYYLSEVLDESTDTTSYGGAHMIHWTVPLARAFAEQAERIRVGEFRWRALLKRRFEIQDLKITDMGDAYSVYEGGEAAVGGDPFLQRVLTMAGQRAGNIIRTIGQMQSQAVFDRAPLLVVHGVPGSGKTQIGQMRVAYLVTDAAIDPSRRLAADSCLILSPSHALVAYMEAVLPSFGVRGVRQESVQAFLAAYAGVPVPVGHTEPERGSLEFGSAVEEWLKARFSGGVQRLLKARLPSGDGWELTRADVAAAVEDLGEEQHETLRRLLEQRLSRRVKERILKDLSIGWDDGDRRAFREKEAAVDTSVERFVAAAFSTSTPLEDYLEFLRERNLKAGVGEEDLAALALMRLRMTGQRPPSARHVVVDEGQNVSPLAYLVLRRLLPGSELTVLGDLAQRDPSSSGLLSWEELEACGLGRPEVRYLGVNYRSAPAIVDALNAVGRRLGMAFTAIDSVERPGPPVIALATDQATLTGTVARLLDDVPHTTAAVLWRDQSRAPDGLSDLLRQRPDAEGIFFGTRAQAAGLEFDFVIVVGADATSYPDDARAASDLFILASRAQNRLVLLYKGEFTPLMDGIPVHRAEYLPEGPLPVELVEEIVDEEL